jgi:hypothetical protein
VTLLLGAFGASGLILAVVGIYGRSLPFGVNPATFVSVAIALALAALASMLHAGAPCAVRRSDDRSQVRVRLEPGS